jgi:hypothetical protein
VTRAAAVLLALLAALPAQAQAQPADRITLFCRGGVTGGGGGAIALGDGTLLRTRQPRAGAPVEQEALPGRVAPIARWQALLDAARFETLPGGARGNLACSLSRQRDGRAHGLGWSATADLPAPLRQVVSEMQAAVQD